MQRGTGRLFGVGAVLAPVLDLAVGALKNSQQLLVLLQRVPVGVGPAVPEGTVAVVLGVGLSGGGQTPGQTAGHMGLGGDFVPLDVVPRPVGAEHRVRRVLHIGVGVVPGGGHHGLGVVADVVPGGQYGPPAQAVGVGGHLPGIAAAGGHRQPPGQAGGVAQGLRRVEGAAHPLHVGHGPANAVGGQFQREIIPGFQQLHGALCLGGAQPLAHGTVGGLAEIPALGVFQVGAARRQRDLYVGQRCAGQHAGVGTLGQVGQHQPLPVFRQGIRRAVGGQLYTAAPGARFQQQVHFGIMAQRLIMADALHRCGDRFLI